MIDLSAFYLGKEPDCQFLNLQIQGDYQGTIGINFAYAPNNTQTTRDIMEKVKVSFLTFPSSLLFQARYNIDNMLNNAELNTFLRGLNISLPPAGAAGVLKCECDIIGEFFRSTN